MHHWTGKGADEVSEGPDNQWRTKGLADIYQTAGRFSISAALNI